MKKKFREREQRIAELRAQRLQEKREKAKAKEAKGIRERQELIDKVTQLGGVWKTEEAMMAAIQEVRKQGRGEAKGKVIEALKQQISYRKLILEQRVLDPKDWTYSDGAGKSPTVDSLTRKLTKIINQAFEALSQVDEDKENNPDN